MSIFGQQEEARSPGCNQSLCLIVISGAVQRHAHNHAHTTSIHCESWLHANLQRKSVCVNPNRDFHPQPYSLVKYSHTQHIFSSPASVVVVVVQQQAVTHIIRSKVQARDAMMALKTPSLSL